MEGESRKDEDGPDGMVSAAVLSRVERNSGHLHLQARVDVGAFTGTVLPVTVTDRDAIGGTLPVFERQAWGRLVWRLKGARTCEDTC